MTGLDAAVMNHEIDLGTKTFAMNDQWSMAQWSGDRNPMHVDEIVARRLITGLPVVHGVHVALEALSRWGERAGAPCNSMRAEFSKPISVGDVVMFSSQQQGAVTVLQAKVDGAIHMSLALGAAAAPTTPDLGLEAERLPWGDQPLDDSPGAWLDRTCELPAVHGDLASVQRAASVIGADGIHLLGQLSTLVGMGCPGLHSIFSSFELHRSDARDKGRFRVVKFDNRFRLMRIAIQGAWRGEVRAFVRSPPQPQPSMEDVMRQVRPQLPQGHRSWVLGGSRGLGELAAKVAAAAGSQVLLTYASGRDDALRVAQEINAAGRGRALVGHYRVGETDPREFCSKHDLPGAVFFFATPRIAGRRRGVFDPQRLHEFLRVYCEAPAELAICLDEALLDHPTSAPLRIFSPSSSYVEELPNGMLEYAMAKAASEVMARDLNKRLRRVQFSTSRLPKLPTDQTSGILAAAGPSALDVVTPHLLATLA